MACRSSLTRTFPVGPGRVNWTDTFGRFQRTFPKRTSLNISHDRLSHQLTTMCKSLKSDTGFKTLAHGQHADVHRGFTRSKVYHGSVQQFRTLVTMVTDMNKATAASLRLRHLGQVTKGKQLLSNVGSRQASSDVGTASKRKWPRYLATGVLLIVSAAGGLLAFKIYNFRKRGVRPFYIPNLPLQLFGPCASYKGMTIITSQLDSIEKAHDFIARKDDVFVISFPRSGTTWTQELVYLIGNQADVRKANSKNMEARFPYLEDPVSNVAVLDAMDSPRFIKTHLPYRLLPPSIHDKKPKIIYVMRNPKDVIVSCFHLWRKLRAGYQGSFEEYCQLFLQDKMLFAPWFDHVREFWERREDENILFITYEDLTTNLSHEVERISKFLGKHLSPEQVKTIVDHCSFDSMKTNDSVNYRWWDDRGFTTNIGTGFIRKGKVGDWKNFFTPEMDARVMAKVERPLAEIGLKVKYEVACGDGTKS